MGKQQHGVEHRRDSAWSTVLRVLNGLAEASATMFTAGRTMLSGHHLTPRLVHPFPSPPFRDIVDAGLINGWVNETNPNNATREVIHKVGGAL